MHREGQVVYEDCDARNHCLNRARLEVDTRSRAE